MALEVNEGLTVAGNLTIGVGAAGVDYVLTFNGEDNDGTITYDEDLGAFLMNHGLFMSDTIQMQSLTASTVLALNGSKNMVSLTKSSAYTPSNVSTDRSYDADTVLVAELADVVGTLIADLQTANILA